MKVIAKDNFDREHISECVIKENITQEEAEKICKEHNDQLCDDDYGGMFYVVKPDNYVPYKWEP